MSVDGVGGGECAVGGMSNIIGGKNQSSKKTRDEQEWNE